MDQYSREEVERSVHEFKNLSSDLMRAEYGNWRDSLTHFLDFCQDDPIMRLVVQPLIDNPNVNIDQWLSDFAQDSQHGMPSDKEDRIALIFQLLQTINSGK